MPEKSITTDPVSSQRPKPRKQSLVGPRRGTGPHGTYRESRDALQPGVITRREWLRFLYRVEITDACDCSPGMPHRTWQWRGHTNPLGYGSFSWRGQQYQAHRFACIAMGKTIPNGYDPDHICRIPGCVNPDCIEVVPHRINTLRGIGLTARYAERKHCPQGHLLTGDNLLPCYQKRGIRVCRLCTNAAQRRSYHQNKPRPTQIPPRERTHCPAGHPLIEENLVASQLKTRGWRICRICTNERQRIKREEKKGL